jgi:hypothetical protein
MGAGMLRGAQCDGLSCSCGCGDRGSSAAHETREKATEALFDLGMKKVSWRQGWDVAWCNLEHREIGDVRASAAKASSHKVWQRLQQSSQQWQE